MARGVKARWHSKRPRTPEENGSVLAAVGYKGAILSIQRLLGADFELESHDRRFTILAELLAFQVQMADRLAHDRLDDISRHRLISAMGKNLAVELAPRGIRVNVLSPGFIGGTTIDFNLERDDMIAFVKRSIANTPLGHPGEPRHMADAALFLATCEFASGQVIAVDGGWTAT